VKNPDRGPWGHRSPAARLCL